MSASPRSSSLRQHHAAGDRGAAQTGCELDAEFPRLTYLHRSWRDAEMYFFFNESNKEESRIATVAGRGQAQAWDLATGEIHPISSATAEGDSVRVPLVLEPYEAKLIVVGPLPPGPRPQSRR